MSSKAPANVFAAFNRGLTRGAPANTATPAATPQDDTLVPTRALLRLADSPRQTLPFAEFRVHLPGDNLDSMSSALQLMKRGWVEFIGDISESSDVHLTPSGQELADTLRKSFG